MSATGLKAKRLKEQEAEVASTYSVPPMGRWSKFGGEEIELVSEALLELSDKMPGDHLVRRMLDEIDHVSQQRFHARMRQLVVA